MTWCVCVMHLRFSKPMDKCTPRTHRITWWPLCRQKWPWNWTPSPSILCIQEPTLHCREWHRCSDLQGRTPHHAISFDFAARYDGRWMSSNHFFIKLTVSHSGQPLTWAQRWDPNNQWLLPRAYQPPKITTITTFNGLVLTPSPSSPASTCSAFARWWRTVMFLGL